MTRQRWRASLELWTAAERQTHVRQKILSTVVVVFLIAACGGGTTSREPVTPADSAELMAAALNHLVSEDHTFGDGPPPFTEFLIREHTISSAMPGDEGDEVEPSRPLTDQERAAVEDVVSGYGPVRWVDDPDEWRTEDLQPKVAGSVILGVGVPRVDSDGALVSVSLWCSGLCGTWLTYRLERSDAGAWRVTGTEGPIAIS